MGRRAMEALPDAIVSCLLLVIGLVSLGIFIVVLSLIQEHMKQQRERQELQRKLEALKKKWEPVVMERLRG